MEGERSGWAGKAIAVIITTSIFFRSVCASNHSVGGPTGWDLRSNLQLWSAATTFLVGDYLVFTYTPNYDVVEVNQQGYDMCIISNAIGTYDDGETVMHLTEPGIRYFVCGRSGHCQQGVKIQVQVFAQANNGTNGDANNGGSGGQLWPPPRKSPPSPQRPLPPPPRSPPPPPPPLQSPPPPPRQSPPHPPPHSPPPADVRAVPISGVDDIMGDTRVLFHGLVPVITLVVLSFGYFSF